MDHYLTKSGPWTDLKSPNVQRQLDCGNWLHLILQPTISLSSLFISAACENKRQVPAGMEEVDTVFMYFSGTFRFRWTIAQFGKIDKLGWQRIAWHCMLLRVIVWYWKDTGPLLEAPLACTSHITEPCSNEKSFPTFRRIPEQQAEEALVCI